MPLKSNLLTNEHEAKNQHISDSRVIRERDRVIVVRAGDFEGMRKLVLVLRGGESLQTVLIPQFFEVRVIGGNATSGQELDDTRIGERVQVTAEEEGNRIGIRFRGSGSEARDGVLQNRPQLVHQHHRLDQLHVTKLSSD